MLAAAGVGSIQVADAAATWPRHGVKVFPRVEVQAVYDELHELFQEEYRSHRSAFVRLRALAEAEPGRQVARAGDAGERDVSVAGVTGNGN
jgi:hypothetical protein